MRRSLLLIVLQLASFFAIGQTNNWTWVHGDSVTRRFGIYGNLGVSSPTNKPGTRDGSVTWTDNTGKLWLFGGHGYTANTTNRDMNDLWRYDPAINEWTWIKGDSTHDMYGVGGYQGIPNINNKPGARAHAVTWTDNAGNLWLFGGIGSGMTSSGALNELWRYEIGTNTWTWLQGATWSGQEGHYGVKGVTDPADFPGARFNCNSWTDLAGNLWLFGGRDQIGHYFNDLWKYDIANNTWTWMSGDHPMFVPTNVYGTMGVENAANKPGGRHSSMQWRDNDGYLWLYGGFKDGTTPAYYGDLWRYNISTGHWAWMKGYNTPNQLGIYGTMGAANANNKPGGKRNAVTWADNNGNLWLLGGTGYTSINFPSTFTNDLWRYNIAANNWAWIKGSNTGIAHATYGNKGVPNPNNKPGGRYESVSWVGADNTLWLFGGHGVEANPMFPSSYLNDLWSFSPISIVPLRLLSFDGKKVNHEVQLKWQSTNEINMSHFVVNRSVDGNNFTSIGTVPCTNNAGTNTYHYTDIYPATASRVFYKLQIIDRDGSAKESNTIRFNISNALSITVSPNPVKGSILISGQSLQLFQLYNDAGALIRTIPLNGQNNASISLSGIAAGIYFVRVNDQVGNVVSVKIVVTSH